MTTLPAEILRSIHYREGNKLPMPSALKQRAFKALDDLGPISADYHDRITQALIDYFEGANTTGAKNAFKKAVSDSFNDAFDLGYVDGGADLPTDADANDWLNARKEAEFGFVETVFQQAKELKKEDGFDYLPWVSSRADGYVATLQGIYNAGKMWAKKNELLSWFLGSTEVHCSTCKMLADGPAHRASWYLARNYIPRTPGANLDCHGDNCDCELRNKQGEAVTI